VNTLPPLEPAVLPSNQHDCKSVHHITLGWTFVTHSVKRTFLFPSHFHGNRYMQIVTCVWCLCGGW